MDIPQLCNDNESLARRHTHWPRRVRGAATTELIVVLLSLGPVALGGIQTALIFHAKSTLNYATFEAARTGSVRHAQSRYMRKALVEHLRPLYGGGHDTASLAESYGRARLDIMSPVVPGTAIGAGTKIEILSPTIEAFDDHGKVQEGEEQIPNQHLRYRARTVGSTSGVNIQDANILKIKVTYGYKLYVPVINKLIARSLMVFDSGNSQYYLADPPRLPIVAQATMRMQSNPKPDPGYNASSPGAGAGMGSGGGTAPPPGNDGGGNTGGGDDGGGGGDTGGGGDDTGAGGDDPGDDVGGGGDGSDPCADGSCSEGDTSCSGQAA